MLVLTQFGKQWIKEPDYTDEINYICLGQSSPVAGKLVAHLQLIEILTLHSVLLGYQAYPALIRRQ